MQLIAFIRNLCCRQNKSGQREVNSELVDFVAHKLGVFPKDVTLYEAALPGRMFSPELQNERKFKYQRLEFLGDAVIEIAVTDYLFNTFAEYDEGALTQLRAKIVCKSRLAKICTDIGLTDLLLERLPSLVSSDRVKANMFEAFFGALYLDQGGEVAKHVLQKQVLHKYVPFDEMILSLIDGKTYLLQWAKQNDRVVKYRTVPDMENPQRFVTTVHVDGKRISSAIARRKREAEIMACESALRELGIRRRLPMNEDE